MRKIHAPERHNRVLTKNLYQGANVCLTHHKLCSFPIVLISAQAVPILRSSSAHRYRQGRKEELLLPLGPCTLRQKLLYSVNSLSPYFQMLKQTNFNSQKDQRALTGSQPVGRNRHLAQPCPEGTVREVGQSLAGQDRGTVHLCCEIGHRDYLEIDNEGTAGPD